MANLFVQARLNVQSSLPEDLIVNTFTFSGVDAVDPFTSAGIIILQLDNFYGELVSEDVLGPWFTGAVDYFVYEIQDLITGELGSPILVETLNAGTPSGGTLPAEVALCVSLRGTSTGDPIPVESRRGRIYIGPIRSSVSSGGDGTDPPRPNTADVVTLADAAETLGNTVSAAAGYAWGIWSRKVGAISTVSSMFVDNEFDTMRSRGLKATSRESRP